MASGSPSTGLEEELSCPICLEWLKEPVTLDCGHNFCRGCITDYCDKWEELGDLECPVCKAEIQKGNFRSNWQLANVVEKMKQIIFLETEKKGVCQKHQEPLKLFCRNDEALICVVCDRSKEHRDHETLPLEEASQEYKDQFCNRLEMLKKERERIVACKAEVVKESQDLLKQMMGEKQEMAAKFRQLHSFLEEQEKRLLAQMEEMEKELPKNRDQHLAELSEALSSLDSLIREMEQKCQQPASQLLQDARSTLQSSGERWGFRSSGELGGVGWVAVQLINVPPQDTTLWGGDLIGVQPVEQGLWPAAHEEFGGASAGRGVWCDVLGQEEVFLDANDVTDPGKKRSLFFRVWDLWTFQLAQSLLAPTKLNDMPFTDIMAALGNHFATQPTQLARSLAFHLRDQEPGESVATYLAALRQTAHFCAFLDLDGMLRDRFIFGLRNEKVCRRLVAKDVSLTAAIEEATAAEASTRADHLGDRSTAPPPSAPVPIHYESTSDEEVEDEAHKMAARVPSCGEPHNRRTCHFHDTKCQGCSQVGHITKACRSVKKERLPGPGKKDGAAQPVHELAIGDRSSPCCCRHNVQSIQLHKVHGMEKVSVSVQIEGTPCEVEVDSGSALSIISKDTFHNLGRCTTLPKLQLMGIIISDYQRWRVPVRGVAYAWFQYNEKEALEDPLAFPLVQKWHIWDFSDQNLFLEGIKKPFKDTLDSGLFLQKANVTLDPDTAHPQLLLSEDRKSVRRGEEAQALPSNPERFDEHGAVLGHEGFTAGRHFWEVLVGSEEGWTVGVAIKSGRRKGVFFLSPEEEIWAVGKWRGDYWAGLKGQILPLTLTGEPKRIRVCLNYAGGRVAFLDADRGSLIYEFSGAPFRGETLLPYFEVCSKAHLKVSP
uniref:uncharacterized protein LOC130493928 n=1 Tax=Euleptes europaea TaxID=460621 RepID=UPI00254043AB|nr:uncharacterized protein LOC130493928 [Euleptes europaea]